MSTKQSRGRRSVRLGSIDAQTGSERPRHPADVHSEFPQKGNKRSTREKGRIGGSGWSVTFENPDPCAVKGSSVAFRCSYSYREGETVRETAWSKGHIKQHNWKRVELSDLASYENRSVYLGDRQHNCSLAIHDVQGNDSGYYYFRFDTDTYGWRSRAGESVHLSVTELSARVHPERVRAGDDVTLECGTSCYRPPGTVWFKDGRPVANLTFQAQPGDSGNYSCAIEGQESDPSDPVALDVQYAPLNMSIEVSQPGDVAEGSSVNPTCSAVANPAADNYTWYGASVSSSSSSAMLWVGSGQVLTLPPGKASHAGLYLCQARNSVGENSREVLLTGYHTDTAVSRVILFVGIGVKCVILLLLSVFIIWAWKKMRNSAVDEMEQCHDYENTMNMKNINNHLFPGHLNNLASCDHNTCVSKGESNEYSSMIAVQ
ncbi:hypothetical protein F2P81_001648 [Scophthalmus maximus]|uniref:Ig-like domain-containing protein n=1 Tax=Scophthalmus maximus TaxID=52904 RepID=A0A6A4TJX3_SCOMX|nr:hypothetical protein F2P81_001648 [Scophthalmus maximus]